MALQITLIGLGQVGASLGLALAGQANEILRVGHDRSPETARKAEKLGAVDKISYNLHQAVEKADIVVLAIPVDEIQETLKHIAPDLKENASLLDTSYAMAAVGEWVKELLPANLAFATLSPSVNPKYLEENESGIGGAHADLFQKGMMVITCPPGRNPAGLRIASELAQRVGASPLYADPIEFEGLTSANHLLPKLAAAALVHAVMDQPGWREGRKLAGQVFAAATSPILRPDEAKAFGKLALLNRANTLRVLDNYINELHALRQAINDQEEAWLQERLLSALEARLLWQGQRQAAEWEMHQEMPVPTSGEVLGSLIGLRPKKRTPKK